MVGKVNKFCIFSKYKFEVQKYVKMVDLIKMGFFVYCFLWIVLVIIYGVLLKGWLVVDIFFMCYNFCVKCYCLFGIFVVCVVLFCVRINFYRLFIVELF